MKKIILISTLCALCICLGVIVAPVSAAHDYYDVKPTIDSNPTHQDSFKEQMTYGTLKVILRCGSNTHSPTFIITNLNANVSRSYSINPSGFFESEFCVGNYSVYLPIGNGNQPEATQYFKINAQETSYITFLGNAIGTNSAADVITVHSAKYGAIERRSHQELIKEAYDTRNGDYKKTGMYYMYCDGVDAIYVVESAVSDRNGKYIRVGNHYEQIYGSYPGQKYNVVFKLADVTHHEAEYKTIYENYGSMIDVTSEIQDAVNAGHRSMMFFDNAQIPGGLFVLGNLFRQIDDPAVGIVKDLIINYDINGIDKELVTKEYQEIVL